MNFFLIKSVFFPAVLVYSAQMQFKVVFLSEGGSKFLFQVLSWKNLGTPVIKHYIILFLFVFVF